MQLLYKCKGIKISLIICLALLSGLVRAQDRIVTGVVKDQQTSEVLPGVNVAVKGTAEGTITDANGEYKIAVGSDDATLVFSTIGYAKQETPVGQRAKVDIGLATDITSLEEVVVVGYGEQKKSNITGAISSVKATDFQDMPNTRVEDAMKGRTSGITITAASGQPGSGSSIQIRGVTSIGNSDPLFVVDGVVVTGGIDYLNPGDIESIEVLKDAASAAIYGTKAAAGVILVTTKKGKAGTVHVNVNSYFGSQQPAHKLALTNATEYATLRNESVLGGGGTALPFANPSQYGKGTDWQGQIFDNSAYIQNSDLNISGGTDKSTYYAGVGYFKQDGIVAPSISNYNRYSLRLNSTHKVTKWFTFGENFSATYTRNSGVDANNYYGGVLGSAINIDPITPVTNPLLDNPDPLPYQPGTTANPFYGNRNIFIRDGAGNPYSIPYYVGQEVVNPTALIKRNTGNGFSWADKIVANVYLEIEPIKGLKLRSSIGGDYSYWGSDSFTPLYYLSPNNNNTTGNQSLYRGINKQLNWTFTNTATYTKSIDGHNFNATIGTEARDLGYGRYLGVTYQFKGAPYHSLKDASFNNVNEKTLPSYDGNGSEYQPYRIASYFARLNYDYQSKYLLTAIVRRDGSTRFGANKQWGVFPSVSVGWVPSLESFWPQNNVVDVLKIRAGYGTNGSDNNLGPFFYTSTITNVGAPYPIGGNITQGYAPGAPANPNLHWEQTTQSNIAIDATLLSNLTVSVDYFQKNTTGMLMPVSVPLYLGATSNPYDNIANMKNHGVEVNLGYKKQVGEVGLNFIGNFTYVRNNITKLDGVHQFLTYGSAIASSAEISRKAIGQPVNAFYGYKREGIFQTQQEINSYVNSEGNPIQPDAKPGDVKWKDISGDGQISLADRQYLGDPTPHYIFGFTATANYRNFDFKVFAQGVAGNKIYNALRRLDITTANYPKAALNRWTGPGTSNSYPRLSDNDPNGNFTNPSDLHLESGAFLRLKTIQLGYNFPKSMLNKVAFQNARLYVSVNNIYTFTKYTGYDPEIGGDLFGQDHGVYPQARSYMVGFNLTF